MKSVLIFPIKSYSERVPGKNFKVINGKWGERPLYQHFPMTCKQAGVFDKIVIDTDSQEIREWAKSQGIDVLTRISHLATNEANGNDLLRVHRTIYDDYDFLWQGFVTTPFISAETVKDIYFQLTYDRSHMNDSIMTCRQLKGFFWSHDGRPLHHRPDVMPRSQDLAPIFQERHGLFGITRKAFDITRTRAGAKPYPYVLPDNEDVDIDWPSDLVSLQQQKLGHNKPVDFSAGDSHLGCA